MTEFFGAMDTDGLDAMQEALEQVTEAEMRWNARFHPVVVRVLAEYAKYVEYGTGPAKERPPRERPRNAETSAVYAGYSPYANSSLWSIREWVASKLGVTDPAEWERTSYAIWRKIMMEGRPPAPFARPAMEDTIQAIDDGVFNFNEGGADSRDIAAYLVSRMEFYLTNGNEGTLQPSHGLPTTWTGHLLNSIVIEDAPEGSPTISVDIIEDMDDPIVRDSATLGYYEKNTPGAYDR